MMERLRICAALLSLLSLAVAVWALVGTATVKTFAALIFASACLAVVSPFDAPEPRRRTRVVIAVLIYVGAVAAALAFGHIDGASRLLMSAMVVLAQIGAGLACWAFATRNRRRRSEAGRYFDN